MIQKRVLVPSRLRRPPATGWSWVDRRFLREHAAGPNLVEQTPAFRALEWTGVDFGNRQTPERTPISCTAADNRAQPRNRHRQMW